MENLYTDQASRRSGPRVLVIRMTRTIRFHLVRQWNGSTRYSQAIASCSVKECLRRQFVIGRVSDGGLTRCYQLFQKPSSSHGKHWHDAERT